MSLFGKIFRKKTKPNVPPMPAWETIVEMMYDRHLEEYADELVQVIYSKDRSKRYLILKDDKGFFTYQLETIYQYDPDDWPYLASNKDVLPAMWEPFPGITGRSIFENTEELLKEMSAEPEYQRYF